MSFRCSSRVVVARVRSVNVWMLARPANAYASQLGVGPMESTDVAEMDRRRSMMRSASANVIGAGMSMIVGVDAGCRRRATRNFRETAQR